MNDINDFLSDVTRIIHIGADVGQEIELYDQHKLYVAWIDCNPETYNKLLLKLARHYRQTAYKALITDRDYEDYNFYVANNGASSSILPMQLHAEIWKRVHFIYTITLRSITLPTLLSNNKVDETSFDALVLDTQGSELLILKGAIPMLSYFKYIKVEVPDFESYKGCCQINDLATFMQSHNFVEHARQQFAGKPEIGNYYDIVYRNTRPCATT